MPATCTEGGKKGEGGNEATAMNDTPTRSLAADVSEQRSGFSFDPAPDVAKTFILRRTDDKARRRGMPGKEAQVEFAPFHRACLAANRQFALIHGQWPTSNLQHVLTSGHAV